MEDLSRDPFGKAYDIVLHWSITNTCNFSCPHCISNAVKPAKKFAPEVINIRKLKKLLNGNEIIRFNISGGEPFLVKNFIKVLKVITKRHYFSLMTNLVSPRVKELAEKIDPDRNSFIVASAHMSELIRQNLLKTYLQHSVLLKSKGFTVQNNEIAYPFIVKKVEEYNKIFLDQGLDLRFTAFQGTWNGKTYPDAYTPAEIEVFGLQREMHQRPDIYSFKGQLCIAGYNAGAIVNDGNIFPCYSLQNKIGKLGEPLHLFTNMVRCPYDSCSCPFNVYEPVLYKRAMLEYETNNKLTTDK